MDRLVQRNVLAIDLARGGGIRRRRRALLLDKTGTITLGNRQAAEFLPVGGVDERELAEVAQLASLADETPEGLLDRRAGEGTVRPRASRELGEHVFVPFPARQRG